MAKTKSQGAQRSRAARPVDAEQRSRVLLIGGVVAVVLVALGFIGFGWYQTQIKPLSKTILRVGETKFSLAHLERRMELERQQNPFYAQPQQQVILADAVFQRLEQEAKLLEAAEQLDISVTEEEIANEIKQRGNLAEEAGEKVYGFELARQVEASGLGVNEYQQMLRAELLELKVRDYFTFLAPSSEPQVHARWIAVSDEARAEEALQRLDAGEDFAAVAREESEDVGTAEEGGDLGWRPRGGFPDEEMEDFLFEEAQPGQHSEVLSTVLGLYIVQLVEPEQDRELDEVLRSTVVAREMTEWLEGLDNTLDVERDFTAEDRDKALRDVIL